MIKLTKEDRQMAGIALLVVGALLAVAGGGYSWGVTGMLWSGAVTAAVYGLVLLISSVDP